MKPLHSLSLHYHQGQLRILDQQNLPSKEEWIDVKGPEEMVAIIRSLKVRGAPLIGISAALTLAQMAENGASAEEIMSAGVMLRAARPTAVNLMVCIDKVLAAMDCAGDFREAILVTAQQLFEQDQMLCQEIGEAGAALIKQKENILTYCNTGGLATAGIGTALGVVKVAHEQRKEIHVYACETRPLLQGARLTTWELHQSQIPHTLICDNMAGQLMSLGKIDRVFVGADRIAANGDFANKIGTYTLAVLAKHHSIPFHVVAPFTTFDENCPDGSRIAIEERSADEVKGVSGSFGKFEWCPPGTQVYNPAFDVTPGHLVTSYISDTSLRELQKI